MICRKLRQNIETTSANLSKSAHHQPTTRCREVIPVTIQYSILEKSQCRLETHLGERTDVTLETHSVEWCETTVPCHVVTDQVQVAVVDLDTVGAEDTIQLIDNVLSSCLDTVNLQDSCDVVGLDVVGVDEIAVLLHSLQVDAFCVDDSDLFVVPGLLMVVAGSHTRDLLDHSLLDSILDKVEHKHLGNSRVKLEREAAFGSILLIEREIRDFFVLLKNAIGSHLGTPVDDTAVLLILFVARLPLATTEALVIKVSIGSIATHLLLLDERAQVFHCKKHFRVLLVQTHPRERLFILVRLVTDKAILVLLEILGHFPEEFLRSSKCGGGGVKVTRDRVMSLGVILLQAFSDAGVVSELSSLRSDILQDEAEIFQVFLFASVKTILTVHKLDHGAIGISNGSIVRDSQALHTLDDTSLQITGTGCLDGSINQTFSTSHMMEIVLLRTNTSKETLHNVTTSSSMSLEWVETGQRLATDHNWNTATFKNLLTQVTRNQIGVDSGSLRTRGCHCLHLIEGESLLQTVWHSGFLDTVCDLTEALLHQKIKAFLFFVVAHYLFKTLQKQRIVRTSSFRKRSLSAARRASSPFGVSLKSSIPHEKARMLRTINFMDSVDDTARTRADLRLVQNSTDELAILEQYSAFLRIVTPLAGLELRLGLHAKATAVGRLHVLQDGSNDLLSGPSRNRFNYGGSNKLNPLAHDVTAFGT
ncbi:hypothetical protein HG531_000380 [Fusarium graminearum]|nr:hypothetical protein HG531_000380 [Fusarium graminearum]